MTRIIATAAAGLLWAGAALAGEYHSGGTLLCADCHTMHSSMQHGFSGGAVGTTPQAGGDWVAQNGPNNFLLKATANQLCLSCHDGKSFAPDVLGANSNASPSAGRSAGALNAPDVGGGYAEWKGHTLGSTATPPGYNPTAIGAPQGWYDPTNGLSCTSCHAQHGPTTAFRNLGPYSLGAAGAVARPSYAIATTNDASKDVWVNLDKAAVTPGSGDAATFNPYYDARNISFNRNDRASGTTKTSNAMDTFCAACHGSFHGGAEDAEVKGHATPGALDGFARHPTSGVTIGDAGKQGFGGHSSLERYVANTNKVRVYASDRVGFTDAAPGCVTCHKAHGNQNPFSLIFMNRSTGTVGEEGAGTFASALEGQRALCGQCHGQGL